MKTKKNFITIILISATFVLISGLMIVKATQNEDRRSRYKQRDQYIKLTSLSGMEIGDQISMAARQHMFLKDFETAFGTVSTLQNPKGPDQKGMTHYFYHAPSQRVFYLWVQNGELRGFNSNYGYADIKSDVVLETPPFIAGESIRNSILGLAILLWIVSFIAGIFMLKFRQYVGAVLIFLSIICGLCWFLAPNYLPTMQGIFSNDNLAAALFMLFISLVYGLITLARETASPI